MNVRNLISALAHLNPDSRVVFNIPHMGTLPVHAVYEVRASGTVFLVPQTELPELPELPQAAAELPELPELPGLGDELPELPGLGDELPELPGLGDELPEL